MASILSTAAVSAGQDLFTDSATQYHDLGARIRSNDGRTFTYCKVGASNLVADNMVQGPALVANHQNLASTTQAIGDNTVTVTLGATAATANQYAGGQLIINAGTGKGQSLKIKSHPAANSAATLLVTLEDPFIVATSVSDTKACLSANAFNGVIQMPTTLTGVVVGAVNKAYTAGNFCWVQTYGQTSILSDGAATQGVGAAVPSTVAGAVKVMAATLTQVGQYMQAGVDTEARAVFLNVAS